MFKTIIRSAELHCALLALLLMVVAGGCSSSTAADVDHPQSPELAAPLEEGLMKAASDVNSIGKNFNTTFPFQNVLTFGLSNNLFFYPDQAVDGDAFACYTFNIAGQSNLEYIVLDWGTAPGSGAVVRVWEPFAENWQAMATSDGITYHLDNMQSLYAYNGGLMLTFWVSVDENDIDCVLENITVAD